jgi:hypothetical protein
MYIRLLSARVQYYAVDNISRTLNANNTLVFLTPLIFLYNLD